MPQIYMVLLMNYLNLEYHPSASRIRIVKEDISQTLNARMGTGGGNVPLILVILDDKQTEHKDINNTK